MIDFLQLGRPLTITTPLPPGTLLAAGLRGREAVNELFAFEVHLLAPVEFPPVDYNTLLGTIVTVRISADAGPDRLMSGTVTDLAQTDRDRDYTHFHATVRPRATALCF